MPAERLPDLPDLDLSMLVKTDLPDRIVLTTVEDEPAARSLDPAWSAGYDAAMKVAEKRIAAHLELIGDLSDTIRRVEALAHHHDAQSLINGCGLPGGRDAAGCQTCDWTDEVKAALDSRFRPEGPPS